MRGMISEFANAEEEKLEVYLCQRDLSLLKAMANTQKEPSEEGENRRKVLQVRLPKFSTALMEMTPFLPAIPRAKFFEDDSLAPGDCQIKSRFDA